MAKTVNWSGHQFHVLKMDTTEWSEHPGSYIFTGLNDQNQWVPYCIGQAGQFCERLANHEQWASAVRLGATYVHAMVVPEQANRDKIEAQLIQAYQPPLNTKLKSNPLVEDAVRRDLVDAMRRVTRK